MANILIQGVSEEKEQQLNSNNNVVIVRAKAVEITDTDSYTNAAEFLKEIKQAANTVKETFKDMKDSANQAHKKVCDKESFFLKPLSEAESIVKNKVRLYVDEMESKRREAEALLRAEQQRAAEEQLKHAMELEKSGKTEQANAAFETVTAFENLEPVVQSEKPQVAGISTQIAYEIIITDETIVPAYFNGAELRQVNLSAIKQLAKATKGNIQIPGVKINKTNQINVRG